MICAGWGIEMHKTAVVLDAQTSVGELKLCLDCLRRLSDEPCRQEPVPNWFDSWDIGMLERAREELGELHLETDLEIFTVDGKLQPYFGFTKTGMLIMDPSRFVHICKGGDWGRWQKALKVLAYLNQSGLCVCGYIGALGGDLHHALVTRGDVQGWSKRWLIHHSFNVVYVHTDCHANLKIEPCFNFLAELYGKTHIEAWLTSMQEGQ